LAVLRNLGATAPRPLDVQPATEPTAEHSMWSVTADDVEYSVEVTRRRGADRPESCGKEPVPYHPMTASVREANLGSDNPGQHP